MLLKSLNDAIGSWLSQIWHESLNHPVMLALSEVQAHKCQDLAGTQRLMDAVIDRGNVCRQARALLGLQIANQAWTTRNFWSIAAPPPRGTMQPILAESNHLVECSFWLHLALDRLG